MFLGQNFLHLFVSAELFMSVVCSWSLLKPQACLPLKAPYSLWNWATTLVCSNETGFEREFM